MLKVNLIYGSHVRLEYECEGLPDMELLDFLYIMVSSNNVKKQSMFVRVTWFYLYLLFTCTCVLSAKSLQIDCFIILRLDIRT